MPTVLASVIITRAAIALSDSDSVRWLRADLLDYLNAGQRALVILKPTAYLLHTSAALVAGTRQTLPVSDNGTALDPIQLIEALRNTAGRAVRLVERELLDALNPDWHSGVQAKIVQNYCYTELDPKTYLVYPPNDGTGCLDLTISATPPPVTSEGNPITLDDIWQGALLDYCLFRAFSRDAEYAADPARAGAHYANFAAAVGGKAAAESAASPTRIAHASRS